VDLEIDSTDIWVVLGKRRAGKTELLRVLSKSIPCDRLRVVDPVGELGNRLGVPYHKVFGNKQADSFWGDLYREGEERHKKGQDERHLIALDEADEHTDMGGRMQSSNFYRLVNYGRNFEFGLLAASRRPANLPKDFLSNADHLCIFRFTEPNDVDYLQGIIGDLIEKVKVLPDHVFVLYDPPSSVPYKGLWTVQGDSIVRWRPTQSLQETPTDEGGASSVTSSSTDTNAVPGAPTITDSTGERPHGAEPPSGQPDKSS
jgi:hypothetical protein